jgi:hypothetical protein
MKNQPPLLHSRGANLNPESSHGDQYGSPSESDHPNGPYFQGFFSTGSKHQPTASLGLSKSGGGDYHDAPCAANEPRPRPYDFPNIGIASERGPARYLGTTLIAGSEGSFLRGDEGHDEMLVPNEQSLARGGASSAQQYNATRPSFAASLHGRPPSMSSSYPTNPAVDAPDQDSKPDRPSTYKAYEGNFQDSESAKNCRKTQTRGNRLPYRPPDTDPTIADIERSRPYNVERIYNAMTRGDKARDNEKSIAMKRWVHGAYYKSHLVEAHCHKVFDCLLEQAKLGYRGWDHNDYVADDRKGEDEDRDVDCAARLDNIIRALEQEKTICEDVMNSACQIRMFVNAPKAYANRKYQNRVGNSKRGRMKDAEEDAAGKPSKLRRTPIRPTTRPRTLSNLQSSTTETRIFSQTPEASSQQAGAPHQQPRYATPPQQSVASPASMSRGTPAGIHARTFDPAQPPSFGINQLNPMSPPISLTPVQRKATVTASQHSPFLSPPDLSQDHLSAIAWSQMPRGPPVSSWPSMQAYDQSYAPISSETDAFFDQSLIWAPGDALGTGVSSNLFEQNPDAALLFSLDQVDFTQEQSRQESWATQSSAQAFPDGLSRGEQGEGRD